MQFARVKNSIDDKFYRYTKCGTIWQVDSWNGAYVQLKVSKLMRPNHPGIQTFEVDAEILEKIELTELEKAIYGVEDV